MIKRLATLSPFAIVLLAVIALGGAVSSATLYRVTKIGGPAVAVDEHGVCKRVKNNNADDVFVPTNTSNEWGLFRTNAPNVELSDCVGVSKVSVGPGSICAIIAGEAKCLGKGAGGVLGNGGVADSIVPVPVTGLSGGVTDISVGFNGSVCAVKGGGLKCWGNNDSGQFGQPLPASSTIPVSVLPYITDAVNVHVGHGIWQLLEYYESRDSPENHLGSDPTCVLRQDGRLGCWNFSLLTGNGFISQYSVLVLDVVSGSTAFGTMCYIQSSSLKCYGNNDRAQLGTGSISGPLTSFNANTALSGDVTGFAMLPEAVCAIQAGAVKCWGDNYNGRLGHGISNTSEPDFVPVIPTGLSSGVTAISASLPVTGAINGNSYLASYDSSSVCVIQNGGVKCWGNDAYGQLGNGIGAYQGIPVQVEGLTSGVTDISVGPYYSCAVQNGRVKCWGRLKMIGLGNQTTPRTIGGF